MNQKEFAPSELILNSDGSIYHLNLHPENLASTVFTVGDPDRVSKISRYFDSIELKKSKREFVTHTGILGGKRISVISTGIGTDNIDIVLNELDALVNIDFQTRTVKENHTSLSIIRIGTSGTFQDKIETGTILASTHGLGLDTLMHYYDVPPLTDENEKLHKVLYHHFETFQGVKPYLSIGSETLLSTIATEMHKGITVTAPGFYAPQGRLLRAQSALAQQLITHLQNFTFESQQLTNLEMETAGIYALANVLGHEALSINVILANRANGTFHPKPENLIQKCIETVLEKMVAIND